MDELCLKLESIIKRFGEGELKSSIFCSDADSQTILTVAKQLNVMCCKLGDNALLRDFLHSEELRKYYEKKYSDAMQAVKKLEEEMDSVKEAKTETLVQCPDCIHHQMLPQTPHDIRMQKRKNRSSSLYFVETLDKTPESEGERDNMVTKDEYNQVKSRVRELEKEIKVQMREKFERAKLLQEYEKEIDASKEKINRLLRENEDFKSSMEQHTNIQKLFEEKKAESDQLLKKLEDNVSFLEKKNSSLEALNQELCEHVLNMNDEMKTLCEDKALLEEELLKKFQEIEENNQSKRYSSQTNRRAYSVVNMKNDEYHAVLTPNKANVVFLDDNDEEVCVVKLANPTPDNEEKFPQDCEFENYCAGVSSYRKNIGRPLETQSKLSSDDEIRIDSKQNSPTPIIRQSKEKFTFCRTSRSKNLEHFFSLYGSARSSKSRASLSCRKENLYETILSRDAGVRNSYRILTGASANIDWLSKLNATEEEKEPKNECSQEKMPSPHKPKPSELKGYQEKYIINTMTSENRGYLETVDFVKRKKGTKNDEPRRASCEIGRDRLNYKNICAKTSDICAIF